MQGIGVKYFFTAFMCVLLSLGNAQEPHKSNWIVGASASYQRQELSFLKTSVWLLKDLSDVNYIRVDGGANFTWKNGKTYVIPELSTTYYLSAKGLWPALKAELTPYTVTPKVSLGLFNILEFGLGYGFDLQEKKDLPMIKGLNWSVGISVPFNYYLSD